MVSLDHELKIRFLLSLGHTLTVAGRNSYSAVGEGLEKPNQLRRINEILHRVFSCLQETLNGSATDSFQRSIAGWVLNQDESEMHDLMNWAWQSTKTHLQ